MTAPCALTVGDFLAAFEAEPEDAALIADEAGRHDFRYRRLPQAERDAVILSVLRRLDGFTQVGAHRHDIWQSAWADVARGYDESGNDLAALEPSFIGATPYIRLLGDYAQPLAADFEFNYFRVLRHWLFGKYLTDAHHVCEFGCGSGFNLVALAQSAPDKRLVGLDWAAPAVDLIKRVAAQHKLPLEARRFDFFAPDPDMALEPHTAVMTFCALEQTSERCTIFLDWLLARRPEIVVSMEPVLDFYDPDSLVDDLAIRYHTRRRYLTGYLPWLTAQAEAGRIELIKARRLRMGSLFHEGFSLLIWRPARCASAPL